MKRTLYAKEKGKQLESLLRHWEVSGETNFPFWTENRVLRSNGTWYKRLFQSYIGHFIPESNLGWACRTLDYKAAIEVFKVFTEYSKLFSLLDRGLYKIYISVEVKKQMAEYGWIPSQVISFTSRWSHQLWVLSYPRPADTLGMSKTCLFSRAEIASIEVTFLESTTEPIMITGTYAKYM